MGTTIGSASIAVGKYYTLAITAVQNSQSTSDNTSNITFTATLTATSSGYINSTASKSYTATINGTTYSGSNTVGISKGSTITLFSKTLTISHDSNGSKSFTFAYNQTFAVTLSSGYVSSKSLSCTVTPSTIARASTITSVTSSVALGGSSSVVFTPLNSTYQYRLKYTIGSKSVTLPSSSTYYTVSSTSAVTKTYEMTLSTWGSYITDATSVTCTVVLTTYDSSGTSIGTSSKTFTVTVPSSAAPSVSATLTESGTSLGYYIQNNSKVTVVASYTLSTGASYKSCTVTIGGISYSGTTVTSSTLTSSGTVAIKVKVTDSRGMSTTYSTSITVYAYSAPQISTFNAYRSDSSGTADTDGEYLTVKYLYSVSSLGSSEVNTCTMTISDGTYNVVSQTYSAAKLSSISTSATTKTITDYTYSTDTSYTITMTVTDKITSSSKVLTIGTAVYPISIRRNGTGVAICKVAESNSLFDVGVNAKIRGTLSTEGSVFIPNGYGCFIYDSDGVARTGISLNSDNLYQIAVGGVTNNINIGNTSYTSTLNLRGSTIAITGAATVSSTLTVTGAAIMSSTLTVKGNIVGRGNIYLPNASVIFMQDSYGTDRTLVALDSSNEYKFGIGGVSNTVSIGTTSYTSTLNLRGSTIAISGAATVSGVLTASKSIYVGTNLIMPNGGIIYAYDSDGDLRTIATLNGSVYSLAVGAITDNTVQVGSSYTATLKLRGSTIEVGTSTVGGTAKPIYLSSGVPTACSSTIGGTAKPVYMSSGTITACSSTVGGTANPVYMSSGTITACSSTVGSSHITPVYMSSGTITSCYISYLYKYSTSSLWVYVNSSGNFGLTSTAGSGGGTLGTSTYKWGTIYSTSSTISTSDGRMKENVVTPDERYEELFMKLKPVNYTWKNITETDNHDRTHCGFIAQEVEEALEEVGLTSTDFATLCYDEVEEGSRPDGRTDEYALAYSELHGLTVHMLQKAIGRIEALEAELSLLKASE